MSENIAIREIISRVLSVPIEQIQAGTALRSLPSADSLRMLSIILEVEKKFQVEIPDDATFRIETIGEFEGLVAELAKAARSERTARPAGVTDATDASGSDAC